MKTAPFHRKMDKFSYILGSNFAICFAYFLAKWPHTHIYTYCTITQALLMIHRYYTFWYLEWHMYLVDYCYFGNAILFYYINYAP